MNLARDLARCISVNRPRAWSIVHLEFNCLSDTKISMTKIRKRATSVRAVWMYAQNYVSIPHRTCYYHGGDCTGTCLISTSLYLLVRLSTSCAANPQLQFSTSYIAMATLNRWHLWIFSILSSNKITYRGGSRKFQIQCQRGQATCRIGGGKTVLIMGQRK